jgi:hypothetical protein
MGFGRSRHYTPSRLLKKQKPLRRTERLFVEADKAD